MRKSSWRRRMAFSAMELLAVVTILGIIAAIIVPKLTMSADTGKARADSRNKATINAMVERWYIEKGTWPASDLSDFRKPDGRAYFPDGIPSNPVDGSAYALGADHRVK